MKNYYEILEINKNASQEIVDKAYKVLVKKYHPDLQQTPEDKNKCEEMIKEINKAYETISDSNLRSEYDKKLEIEYNQKKQYEKDQIIRQYAQTMQNGQRTDYVNSNQSSSNTTNTRPEQYNSTTHQNVQNNATVHQNEYNNYQSTFDRIQQQVSDAINKAYNDAYIEDLKNRGYKIKYKKSFREHLTSIIALILTILIFILLLQIPFVQNWFHEMYENNDVIRYLVDTISSGLKN